MKIKIESSKDMGLPDEIRATTIIPVK